MKNTLIQLVIVTGFSILLGCSNNGKDYQRAASNEDSIKSLILAKESAVLSRWYNGDPMGFIDNSWENVTYFDASIGLRVDSIETFKKLLTPVIGQIHVPSHKMVKPLVQVYGDVAVLTYTDMLNLGENKTSRWHATEIYQRKDNDWKLIHSHWTESKVK